MATLSYCLEGLIEDRTAACTSRLALHAKGVLGSRWAIESSLVGSKKAKSPTRRLAGEAFCCNSRDKPQGSGGGGGLRPAPA
jgi:hypothetical protein